MIPSHWGHYARHSTALGLPGCQLAPPRVPGLGWGAQALTAPSALLGTLLRLLQPPPATCQILEGPRGPHSSAFGLESRLVSPGGRASCSGPHSPPLLHFPSFGSCPGHRPAALPSNSSRAPLPPSRTLSPPAAALGAVRPAGFAAPSRVLLKSHSPPGPIHVPFAPQL